MRKPVEMWKTKPSKPRLWRGNLHREGEALPPPVTPSGIFGQGDDPWRC